MGLFHFCISLIQLIPLDLHLTSVASSSQYDSSYCAPIPQYHPPYYTHVPQYQSTFYSPAPFHILSSATMFSTVVMFILEQTLVHAHLQNTIPKMYQLENDLLLMTTLISFTHVCITAILKSVLPLCQTMGTMVDSVIMINL